LARLLRGLFQPRGYLPDLRAGIRRLPREIANFIRDHRKPRPWLPALAASIAALSANKLV
jgi:hypothetical protein